MAGDRRLPPARRGEFQQPVGRDLAESELAAVAANHIKVITVGDVVSLRVREHGLTPVLSVYDGRTERRTETAFAALVEREGWAETVVVNPAGMVTSALTEAVENALVGKAPEIIRVKGEEDLALLPCILSAPDGAMVIYGWPGRGMKAVEVDGASRHNAERLLGLMEELK